MSVRNWALGGCLTLVAVAAFAHSGVKNPAVMKRMNAMSAVGDATKVLGEMAKGATAFDAAAADAALAVIAAKAAEVPALFEAAETDPKSEALPAIWEDYGDFTAKAKAMEVAAQAAQGTLVAQADVRGALAAVGETCKGCHKSYRK